MPGSDPTGCALGGVEWEDGGIARGGRPYWSAASGGDLGNGYLAAIAICQALYHRERTGTGQEIDTSILNAALFSTGPVYTTPDAKRFDRPTVDADLLGFDALYRLYDTQDGWLCLAVFAPKEWDALVTAIPAAGAFSLADRNDQRLAEILADHFRSDTAANWYDAPRQRRRALRSVLGGLLTGLSRQPRDATPRMGGPAQRPPGPRPRRHGRTPHRLLRHTH